VTFDCCFTTIGLTGEFALSVRDFGLGLLSDVRIFKTLETFQDGLSVS
jgi:hypothetical protein